MKKGFLLDKDSQAAMEAKSSADLELKKAFAELQVKLAESQKGIRICDLEKEGLGHEVRKAELTKSELLALPPDTPTYQTVGRMFVWRGVDGSVRDVEASAAASRAGMEACETRKAYLEKAIAEAKNNLREMIQAQQAKR